MAQRFKDSALMLWKAYHHALSGEADESDINRWLELGRTTLLAAHSLSYSSDLTVADKQKLQASIALIKSVLQLLSERRSGAGLQMAENSPTVNWDDIQSSFENRIKTGVITNRRHLDLLTFMNDAKKQFVAKVSEILKEHPTLKINTILATEYSIVKDEEEIDDIKYFNTKTAHIYLTTELNEWFAANVQHPLDVEMEEFQERGCGWSLKSILNLVINIYKFNPMRGSSYIDLPVFIKNKKACVNVMNYDHQCFKWAILSALHPVKLNANRVTSYISYENELNFQGIEFPVDPRQISKFERQNKISINVYYLKKKGITFTILPRHLTADKKDEHVNLLLVENDYVDESKDEINESVNVEFKFHYVWIKNLSRLVRSQVSSTNRKSFICDRCMHFFWSEEKLMNHTVDCEKMNQYKITLPTKNDCILQFRNFACKNRVPFVVYADFECILKPVNDNERAYQRHKPFSVGFFIKCSYDDNLSEYKSYRQVREDESVAIWFVMNLHALAIKLNKMYKNPRPMNDLTFEEKIQLNKAHTCHICEKPFTENDTKIRDHCHFTGNYRGPAHNTCNINYQDSRVIPIIFHNLSGYDSHLFIREVASYFPGQVSLIPQTKTKYISFTKFVEGTDISLRFIDSFRFMPSSLDKLSSYLEEFDILKGVCSEFSNEQIALLARKGIFPYDYVSSLEKLRDTSLPTKDDFYSSLYDTCISDEDYAHARKVWEIFEIQDLGQYSDLYLKTDVLLLAEVFENFRDNCLETYDLDPAHYYTTPGLTWDAMLKYTKIELELLTDIDMLMFIERGIRGGISQCCNRYAKANNPYMKEGYSVNEKEKYIMYFDVNNLYGWAMTESLPYGGFEWVKDVNQPNFFNIPDDHSFGYFLEVDLDYPKELHDSHKDLPFCAEHLAPPGSKQEKLMTTLYQKKRYVLHYRALKQALDHGLILLKVHRAVKFNQSPWLKVYIDLNSAKRKEAKNEFEKMLFKLFNNAVYGKTMENERKRVNVRLVNKWSGRHGAEALIARPNFHSCDIFDENLVAVQSLRTEICIRKPIYIGLTVLDLSKTLVYRFHYDYMRNRVDNAAKLLYTDTDSLIYEIADVNIYNVMQQDLHEFDTSDYPLVNPFNMPRVNKKKVGLMKDECNGEIVLEFIGLRSKMYSVRVQNQRPIKKAKGVKTSVVKATITFDDYVKCLRENIILRREQRYIRSRHHILHTEKEIKIALSAHDDKRFLQSHTTDTLPWGHCDIVNEEITSGKSAKKRKFSSESDQQPAIKRHATSQVVGATAANHEMAVSPKSAQELPSPPLYQKVQRELDLIRAVEIERSKQPAVAAADVIASLPWDHLAAAVVGKQVANQKVATGVGEVVPPKSAQERSLYQTVQNEPELIRATEQTPKSKTTNSQATVSSDQFTTLEPHQTGGERNSQSKSCDWSGGNRAAEIRTGVLPISVGAERVAAHSSNRNVQKQQQQSTADLRQSVDLHSRAAESS